MAAERPFRALSPALARALAALLLAVLAWSAVAVPIFADEIKAAPAKSAQASGEEVGDFELYSRIHARVANGEPYYGAALLEQRANAFPTRPFVTVRLPTLAYAHKAIGARGVQLAGIALLIGCVIAALALLKSATLPEKVGAALLVLLGGAGVFAEQAAFIHELLAGLLLSLALLVYRPTRWWPSLLLAALALLLRELALPFVLLWLAFAIGQRRWGEAGALVAVIALFAAYMALHYFNVSIRLGVEDRPSPGWNALNGPALPLLSLSLLPPYSLVPLALGAPLGVLSLFGWAGRGGRIAAFAALWFAGFALAISLFARAENFYWIMLILPAFAAGLALAPRALVDLVAAARGKALERQT